MTRPLSRFRCRSRAERPLSPAGRRRVRGEKGYALVLAALLILPLLAFTGFATDVGAWYARANRIQRAADAASLAGVVWMPDLTTARTVALTAARRNGFVNGQNDVTITVSAVPGATRKLRVIIRDSSVDQFFSSLFVGPVEVTRAATAEYVMPVPLGSPLSSFGNDPTACPDLATWVAAVPAPACAPANFWASINGPQEWVNQGDPYSAWCAGTTNNAGCSTSGNNEFRDTGYLYAVDCSACAVGTTLTVQTFDAGFYHRNNVTVSGVTTSGLNIQTGDNRVGGSSGGVRMAFELFRSDNTPLDNSDNPPAAPARGGNGCVSGVGDAGYANIAPEASSATYMNAWRTLCQITVTLPGVFPLQVRSSGITGSTDSGRGTSQYALRASTSTGTQPRVYALKDMSMFNNVGATSDFYLAEVDQVHAGKTFQVSLYDPGECPTPSTCNAFMSVRMPNGTVPACTYRVRGESTSTTLNPCRIQTTSNGGALFDGKWLDIDIQLAGNYTCSLGTIPGCWWRINYEFPAGATPTDRTTWSAQIIGDPVHLTRDG